MEKLTDHFLILLYKLVFKEGPPRMSCGVVDVVSEIKDWFASSNGTFLRVFGGQNSPHLLLRHANDQLVMQEVTHHLSTGLSTFFCKNKKAPWPTLPMQIELYEIKNLKVVDTEGKAIENFAFGGLQPV